MAHPNPSPCSSRIGRETVTKAVDSLLRWIGEQSKHKKAQLLDHDELIHVVVTMKKIPAKGRVNPYLVPLPHPLHSSDTAICLFVDDRRNSPVTPEAAKEKIDSQGIPVSEVVGLRALKSDYVPYEARRKLCGSYELFFADRRILPLLPKLIGKQFFKKKKHPLPIDLSHKNWKEQIRRSCGSALLYLRTGVSCQLNAGRISMGRDEIVDNVIAAVEGAVGFIPKMWANVRSIHVKSNESIGLPIYQALPEIGMKIEVLRKEVEGVGSDNGEVVQGSTKEEVDKNLKKFGSKKGRTHKIRYMDTDLENGGLKSELEGDDGDNAPDGDETGDPVGLDEVKIKIKQKKMSKSRKKALQEKKLTEEKTIKELNAVEGNSASTKVGKRKKTMSKKSADDKGIEAGQAATGKVKMRTIKSTKSADNEISKVAIEGVKKRITKSKKSDAKVEVQKKSKKSKIRH